MFDDRSGQFLTSLLDAQQLSGELQRLALQPCRVTSDGRASGAGVRVEFGTETIPLARMELGEWLDVKRDAVATVRLVHAFQRLAAKAALPWQVATSPLPA